MPMSDTDIIERLRWQKRYTNGMVPVTMEDAAKEIERLREALRAFTVHATYPVSTEINPRGYAWRGEETLDYAMSLANAAGQSVGRTP